MSEFTIEECWNLGVYSYPFYRSLIEKYLHLELLNKKGCLMFDAGCGSKICSISEIPKNVTVIELDIDRKGIHSSHKAAKEKGYRNFHYITGSLTHLPITSEVFDICICIDVIEHLPDKNNAIAEISRVCKPKATLIGSTSNILNPILLFDSLAPKVFVKPLTEKFAPGHFERHKRLNPKKLIQLFKTHGFYTKNITLLGFPPFQPWLYHYLKKEVPIYAYLWILFDKITNKPPLNILKEVIIFNAVKNKQ